MFAGWQKYLHSSQSPSRRDDVRCAFLAAILYNQNRGQSEPKTVLDMLGFLDNELLGVDYVK